MIRSFQRKITLLVLGFLLVILAGVVFSINYVNWKDLTDQAQYAPMDAADQVVVIFAGSEGFADDLPLDRVAAFERELLACLHTITRRKTDAPKMELAFGDISLDRQTGSLRCSSTGKEIKLGAKEYQLLEVFLRNPRQIMGKDLLTDRVWGYDSEAEYNNLEVYISFVRKKLTFVGSGVKIKTTRGLGYSLEDGT